MEFKSAVGFKFLCILYALNRVTAKVLLFFQFFHRWSLGQVVFFKVKKMILFFHLFFLLSHTYNWRGKTTVMAKYVLMV